MPVLYLYKTSIFVKMLCFHASLIKISNIASSKEVLFAQHIHDGCLQLSCRLFRLHLTYNLCESQMALIHGTKKKRFHCIEMVASI